MKAMVWWLVQLLYALVGSAVAGIVPGGSAQPQRGISIPLAPLSPGSQAPLPPVT